MIAAVEDFNSPPPARARRIEPATRPVNPLAPAAPSDVNRPRVTTFVDRAPAQRSDHDLMLAVRAGELDALGELFERHHGPLFGFLVKLTGHRAAAEDIAQTVFQRMLKYRHTYRDGGRFTAWMYHLARRCAADHFRRAGAAPYTMDPSDLAGHADDAPHAAHRAAIGDDHALLHAALARLDRDDREVLLLSRFEELSFAEISALLECSVGAAKVRAHRALRALREIFLQLNQTRPRVTGRE